MGLFFALLGVAGGGLLPVLLMMMTFGAFLGLVPAFLCGIWLALCQTRRNAGGLLHAALAGAATSAVCMGLFTQEIGGLLFGFLGAAAAFLVGALLLPASVEAT